uniref:Cerebral cavernous malformations 2 harmonin-homology domain-containing protein n=1 Tax=Ditylenchus dipsaci TaxID=166011 RepID=A0A915EBN4_9BILA
MSECAPTAPDVSHTDKFASIQSVSTTASSCSPAAYEGQPASARNTSFRLDDGKQPCNTVELINDYLTMLSACLSHEELNKFALLMKRWRAKEMPILEFAQKLLELYGMERKHLLARMKTLLRGVSREELEALSSFLCANGVTENAAESSNSPFWTADMSLTSTEESGSPMVDNISGCSGKWSSSAFAGSRNAAGEAVSHNSQPESSAATMPKAP